MEGWKSEVSSGRCFQAVTSVVGEFLMGDFMIFGLEEIVLLQAGSRYSIICSPLLAYGVPDSKLLLRNILLGGA